MGESVWHTNLLTITKVLKSYNWIILVHLAISEKGSLAALYVADKNALAIPSIEHSRVTES